MRYEEFQWMLMTINRLEDRCRLGRPGHPKNIPLRDSYIWYSYNCQWYTNQAKSEGSTTTQESWLSAASWSMVSGENSSFQTRTVVSSEHEANVSLLNGFQSTALTVPEPCPARAWRRQVVFESHMYTFPSVVNKLSSMGCMQWCNEGVPSLPETIYSSFSPPKELLITCLMCLLPGYVLTTRPTRRSQRWIL